MFYYKIYDYEGVLVNKRMVREPLESARAIEITKEEYESLNVGAELAILDLRANLSDTDYIACKIAEGAATREEYADALIKRAQWRARINELMGE